MEPAEVGRKVKETWIDGVASDGRRYADIPDAELGAKYILKNGGDGLKALGLETKTDNSRADDLRKEFRQETNDLQFKGIRDAYGRLTGAADTPQGDLSIAYAYIKLLDPNSAVREGELATTENTKGISDKIRNAYNKAIKGKRLSQAQRQGFLKEGASIYNTVAKKQKEVNAFYSRLADRAGVDPNDVVGAVGEVELADESQVAGPNIQEGQAKPGLFGGLRGLFEQFQQQTEVEGQQPLAQRLVPQESALKSLFPALNVFDPRKAAQEGDLQAGVNPSGVQAVGEVGGALALSSLLSKAKTAIQGGGGAKEVAKKIANPRGYLKEKELQGAAQSTGKISPKSFLDKAKAYVRDDPEAAKILDKQRSSIQNIKNASDLERKLDVWKRAYTSAGRAGKTPRAGLFQTLYEEGISKLKEMAPEAAKYRNLNRLTYDIPKKAVGLAKLGALGKFLTGGF